MTCRLFRRIWKNKEGKKVKFQLKDYPWMKALQNWWQRVKPTKMPVWWPASLQVDRTEPLVVTPEQYKKFIRIGVAAAIFIVIVVASVSMNSFRSNRLKTKKRCMNSSWS